jgi:RND superfamily putative drug exporter
VLVLLGKRVNALAPAALQRRADRESRVASDGFWYRLSRLVMRFPGRIAVVTTAVLIALGIPALGINFNAADVQVLPTSASARQVDDTLRADFPPYRDTPAVLAVSGSADDAKRVAAAAAELPGAAEVRPPTELAPGLQAIEVVASAPPLSDTSKQLVHDLRGLRGDVQVTGFTAGFLDLKSSLLHHLPIVLAIIAALTLGILFLFTGSVILPLKQLVMNGLGLFAMFGILVLVFQDGRLEGLLGYTSNGAIEATQPLLLFALGFGLATDYGVFLLSRIKEARERGHDDSEAVAIGLERTGRIVTAAALLFAVAVGAFATSEIAFIKQIGVGIALIVLIDATIIRALLVPSLMQMLGPWNWWAPAPLRRLHAKLGVSESPAPAAAAAPVETPAAAG